MLIRKQITRLKEVLSLFFYCAYIKLYWIIKPLLYPFNTLYKDLSSYLDKKSWKVLKNKHLILKKYFSKILLQKFINNSFYYIKKITPNSWNVRVLTLFYYIILYHISTI